MLFVFCASCTKQNAHPLRGEVQISFKYKRLLFTKQENFINFIYFSLLTRFFSHIFNMKGANAAFRVLQAWLFNCFFAGLFLVKLTKNADKRRHFILRLLIVLFEKYEIDGKDKEKNCHKMVPLQAFSFEKY